MTEKEEKKNIEEKKEKIDETKKEESKKVEVKEEIKEKKQKKISKKALKEKAKKLEKKIEKVEEVSLKEKLEESKRKKETLIPLEDYVKYSSYIGTKIIVPPMRQFVYRRRADGIAVINTNSIDEKIKEAVAFLAKYAPEDVIIICKRDAGWKAVELFSKLTGIRAFTKKYPAGIITNPSLPNFFEPELLIVCDPWLDKNALNDAITIQKKVIALCNTNNYSFGVEKVIPCNNRNNKSLGLIFYLITREFLKAKGIDKELPPIEEFCGEEIEEKKERINTRFKKEF